jgi:hypothetical protein
VEGERRNLRNWQGRGRSGAEAKSAGRGRRCATLAMAAAQGSKARGRVVRFGLGHASGAGPRGRRGLSALKALSTFWLCI